MVVLTRWLAGMVAVWLVTDGVSAQARGHKINGELGRSTSQDVDAFRVSDEGHVLFAHTGLAPTFGRTLLSAPVDGGAPPLRLADFVGEFELTPDGSRVIYAGASRQLYSRWVDGAGAPELLGNVGALGQPWDLVISSTGERAVCRALTSEQFPPYRPISYLCSVDLDGSGWRRIDAGGTFSAVQAFTLSEDGVLAAFATGTAPETFWVVPTDGSQAALAVATGDAFFFRFSEDGQRLVFSGEPAQNSRLYSVPVGGGAVARLDTGLSLSIGSSAPGFQPRLVGSEAYFLAAGPAGIPHLYRAPIDGSSPAVRLDGAFTPFAGSGVHAFQLLPGATHAVYAATVAAGNGDQLFRVPTDGSQAAVELSGAFVAGGGVRGSTTADGFVVNSAGTRIAFVADRATVGEFELWSAPSDGSASPVRLGPPPTSGADVEPELAFTPDGAAVLFRIRAALARSELYIAASATVGVFARLSDEFVPGGEALDVVVGPGGQRVFYRADRERDEAFELFSVRLSAPGAPVRLNEPLDYSSLGDVNGFFLAPDGGHVVYHAQLGDDAFDGLHARELRGFGPERDLTDSVQWIRDVLGFSVEGRVLFTAMDHAPISVAGTYSAPLDGLAPPLALTSSETLEVSPDGGWIVFEGSGQTLRSARTDGSSGEVVLATLGGSSSDVVAAPDGQRVLFTSGPSAGPLELLSTRLDGSTAPLRISAPLAPGRGVVYRSLRFSPDGQAVLYLADDVVDDQVELFLASVDGSFPARRLSGPLVANGDVVLDGAFFTPDGTHVVYAADQDVDNQVELYAVPSDGTLAPVKLSQVGVNGAVSWTTTVLSNTHAFFVAAGTVGPLGKLFRVPLDVSAAPQRLTTATGVSDLTLTPDGSRLVFRSGGIADVRLFSVAADGSSGVLLSSGLASDEVVTSFQLSRDGQSLVFQKSTYAFFARQGLFAVPVEGGQAPRLLTPGLAADRSIRKYALAPAGDRVLYLADEAYPDRFELFQSFLVPPRRAR